MNKLIFYNHHNNGDIHYSREFIKDIIKKTNFDEYHFLHKRDPKILLDLNLINGPMDENCRLDSHFHIINEDTYINTHLEGLYDIMYEKIKDVDLPVFYNYFRNIYQKLKIVLEKRSYYVPDIDYSYFNLEGVNNFTSKYSNIKILICNGKVHSSQSIEFDFKPIIESLSNSYPHIHFILTDKKDELLKDNVFYASDITGESCDLNEISYLSINCPIIIGRGSGPYCFTQVKKNLNSLNKIYIFICNQYSDGIWYERNICSKVWINKYDINHILNVIKNQIEKLNNYYTMFELKAQDDKIIIYPLEKVDNIRIEFFNGDDIMYIYRSNFDKGFYHWIIPHGHYTNSMRIRCKFFKDDTNEYLFEKII